MTSDFYNVFRTGRENTRLVTLPEFPSYFAGDIVRYEDLPARDGKGVLKAAYRDEKGRLCQIYSGRDNHACVVAATRAGKTTSHVIPSILSCARQAQKCSLVITDPKGEVYEHTASSLLENGYEVKVLNFKDPSHSEYWNPMTPIYRKYREYLDAKMGVEPVQTEDGTWCLSYKGRLYTDQLKLDRDLAMDTDRLLSAAKNLVDEFVVQMMPVESKVDPTWEQGARDIVKAVVYGMLDDITDKNNPMTEEKFSLETVMSICDLFEATDNENPDKGYFRNRERDSLAYRIANNVLIQPADRTRSSYMADCMTKLREYREEVVSTITRTSTIEYSIFTNPDHPVALYIIFRDDVPMQARTIALFVQRLYSYLINEADTHPDNHLDRPVRFMLDEFGNMPALTDFEKVISTCGARNIWFTIVLQSYAQLRNVYHDAADIIMDNLNIHIFMGSDNLDTLRQFSAECGTYTRISPASVLQSGPSGAYLETIPVMPVSALSYLKEGECVITEINTGYVMHSYQERYYLSPEFTSRPLSSLNDYTPSVDILEPRYKYTVSIPAPRYIGRRVRDC